MDDENSTAQKALETLEGFATDLKTTRSELKLLGEKIEANTATKEDVAALSVKVEAAEKTTGDLKTEMSVIKAGEPGCLRELADKHPWLLTGMRKTGTVLDLLPGKVKDGTVEYVQAMVLAGCNPSRLKDHSVDYLQKMDNISKEMGEGFRAPRGKALVGGGLDAQITATEGGELVPTPFEAIVLRQMEDNAIIRNLATKIPMTAHTHQIPALDTPPTAGIVAEEGTIAAAWSSGPFSQKNLVAKKLATMVAFTGELAQDNAVGLTALLATWFSEAISRLEDAQAIEGDGTGSNFTGLVAATGTAAVTNGANGLAPTYAKLVEQVFAGGKRVSRRNAVWVMSPTALWKILALVDTEGYPLFNRTDIGRVATESLQSGQNVGEGSLLGFPVFTEDQIDIGRTVGTSDDTTNIYFGPMDGFSMIYGDLLGLEFASSDSHASQFASWQITTRALKRTGILVGIPANFAVQTGVRMT